MNGGRLEVLLDHDVGLGEARVDVADLESSQRRLETFDGLVRRRLDAAGDHVLEQQRRVVGHRLVDVDDVRQHLVVDVDELQMARFADRRRSVAATAATACPSYRAFSRAMMLRVTCQKLTATRSAPM